MGWDGGGGAGRLSQVLRRRFRERKVRNGLRQLGRASTHTPACTGRGDTCPGTPQARELRGHPCSGSRKVAARSQPRRAASCGHPGASGARQSWVGVWKAGTSQKVILSTETRVGTHAQHTHTHELGSQRAGPPKRRTLERKPWGRAPPSPPRPWLPLWGTFVWPLAASPYSLTSPLWGPKPPTTRRAL